MVAAELLYGLEKSMRRASYVRVLEQFLSIYEIMPFNLDAARHYAEIRAALEAKGQVIGSNDMIIAATVLAHGGVLVTHNKAEFLRIPNLTVVDWVAA